MIMCMCEYGRQRSVFGVSTFKKDVFVQLYGCACMRVSGYVHKSTDAHRGQRHWNLLGAGGVVRCLTWVLGTKTGSLGRAVDAEPLSSPSPYFLRQRLSTNLEITN